MGKGSAALGVLALILSIGGLGLGGLAWMSVSQVETQLTSPSEQTWYKYNNTVFSCIPSSTYLTFGGLLVEFELETEESVYFSFICRAHTEVVSGWSRITVYFKVDGIMDFYPNAQVGMYNGGFTINYMMHLQDVRNDLLSGIHNVTIVIVGDSTANYIWESSLLVQTVSN